MNNLSFKNVDNKTIKKIVLYYQNKNAVILKSNNRLIINYDNVTVSIYRTNTVLFQGSHAEKEAQRFFDTKLTKITNNKISSLNFYEPNIIGNDEVGVGDVFGPLVITSCYISKDNVEKLKKLNIKDSKKLSKTEILYLAEKLITELTHYTFIIDNQKYNELYDKYKNSHILKALAHNEALINIINNNENLNYKEIIIDQFVNEKKYYEYLKKEKTVINKNVKMITKAEDLHISVACASIISRYWFLKTIYELEKKYNLYLPLGASEKVKTLARDYIKELEPITVRSILKLHFNLQEK